MNIKRLFDIVLSAVYPDRCAVCGEVVNFGKQLCSGCSNSIHKIEGRVCHKCSVSLSEHNDERCRGISAPVVAAYYYRDNVRKLIIDFKDSCSRHYYRCFAEAFNERIAIEYPEVKFDRVVCVPSFEKKVTTSSIISEETAKIFLLDFDADVLEKYRETRKQHRLSMEERFTNLENSIKVREGKEELVRGKIILLCDDVRTTGTTLDECTRALYSAGAQSVYCACIAASDYTIRK